MESVHGFADFIKETWLLRNSGTATSKSDLLINMQATHQPFVLLYLGVIVLEALKAETGLVTRGTDRALHGLPFPSSNSLDNLFHTPHGGHPAHD